MAGHNSGRFRTSVLFQTLTLLLRHLGGTDAIGINNFLENVIKPEGAEVIEYNSRTTGFAELPLEISQSFSIHQKYKISSNSAPPLPSVPVKYIPFKNRWILYIDLQIEDYSRIPLSWSTLVGNNIVVTEGQKFPLSSQSMVPLVPVKNILIVVFQGPSVIQCYGIDTTGTRYVKLAVGSALQDGKWYRHSRVNFNGKPLIWGAPDMQAILVPELKTGFINEEKLRKSDQMLNMMLRVERQLNASHGILIYIYEPQELGNLKAHILSIVMLTPDFLKFGFPILAGDWDGVVSLVRKPYPLKGQAHLSIELIVGQPGPLLLCIVASGFVALVCLVKSRETSSVTIGKVLGNMWALVMELCYAQPLPDDPARSNAARLARIPFLLASLLIISMKQSEFVTHLTATALHYPPKSMEELNQALEDGYKVSFYGIKGTQFLGLVGTQVIQRWEKSFGLDFQLDEADLCLAHLLKNDKHTCLGSRKVAQAAMNVFKGGSFAKSTDGLGMAPAAIYVGNRMAHILDSVVHVMRRDAEAGLHLNFLGGVFERIMKGRNSTINYVDNNAEQIRVNDSLPLVMIALAVSLVVFILEIVLFKRARGSIPPEKGDTIRVEVQQTRRISDYLICDTELQ